MKGKNILISTLLLCAGVLIGYMASLLFKGGLPFMPVLRVIGDVEKPYTVKLEDSSINPAKISLRDKSVKVFMLKDIISNSKPLSESFNILLIGDDGLTAELDGSSLEGCHIAFTAENGWEAVNYYHPVSSNIKRLKEIAVVSKESFSKYGVIIISSDENILSMTPGQMLSAGVKLALNFEGKSSIEKQGKVYQTAVYTSRRLIKLADLIDVKSQVLVMGDGGGYMLDSGEGYLELKENSISYVCSDMKKAVKDLRGIMVDIPQGSNMDTYYDALHYIENDEKVLIIYLDGFGYHQYKHAVDKGYAPFLKTLPEAKRVSTVYQPVTNAGFAAIISGKSPAENGVYSRDQMSLKVPTIFDSVLKMGKKAALIEGNIKILNTKVEPDMNIDMNSNGTGDDEILESALKKIDEGNDLVLVHFHSIDDSGHSSGDLSEKTLETIRKNDEYVRELLSRWEGKVIITSDHGVHSLKEGGEHGSFVFQDMCVPYILTDGEVKR